MEAFLFLFGEREKNHFHFHESLPCVSGSENSQYILIEAVLYIFSGQKFAHFCQICEGNIPEKGDRRPCCSKKFVFGRNLESNTILSAHPWQVDDGARGTLSLYTQFNPNHQQIFSKPHYNAKYSLQFKQSKNLLNPCYENNNNFLLLLALPSYLNDLYR